MATAAPTTVKPRSARFARFRRFGRDDRGAAALEFALVVTPFLIFIFGFIACTMYFFISNSLEKGMDQTSRLIRTGEAITNKMTVDQFKQQVCAGAGSIIDCTKLQIFAEHWPDWSDPSLAPHQCVDKNNTVIQSGAQGADQIATYSGSASDVVVVTTCYEWDFAGKIPFVKLGNMPNGAMMMQTSTSFRTEPFPVAGS